MKRQRALIIAGAAIAIGAVDVIPSVYADRGRPSSTSRSSTTRGRPPSSSSSRGRSNVSSTSPSKKSSPSRQRSVEEILDLDDLLMDESFNLNDDVDDLMGSLGGSNSNNNRDIDMLDDLDDFDYDDFVSREFGHAPHRKMGVKWYWWLFGVAALAAMIAGLASGFR